MMKNKQQLPHMKILGELLVACKQPGVYSIEEEAENLGISYDQIKQWASEHAEYDHMFMNIKTACTLNLLHSDSSNLSAEETKKREALLIEYDPELKEYYEKEESRKKNPVLVSIGQRVKRGNHAKNNKLIKREEDVIESRINQWYEKKSTQDLGYHMVFDKDDPESENRQISARFDNETLTDQQKDELELATLSAATGCANRASKTILFSTLNAMPEFSNGIDDAIDYIQNALLAMDPKDAYEGMLCSQLLVLRENAMRYMKMNRGQELNINTINACINWSTKLMRLYNETMNTLMRYRRNGEQIVRIEHQHVQVNQGGQAIVAKNFNNDTGVNQKSEV